MNFQTPKLFEARFCGGRVRKPGLKLDVVRGPASAPRLRDAGPRMVFK